MFEYFWLVTAAITIIYSSYEYTEYKVDKINKTSERLVLDIQDNIDWLLSSSIHRTDDGFKQVSQNEANLIEKNILRLYSIETKYTISSVNTDRDWYRSRLKYLDNTEFPPKNKKLSVDKNTIIYRNIGQNTLNFPKLKLLQAMSINNQCPPNDPSCHFKGKTTATIHITSINNIHNKLNKLNEYLKKQRNLWPIKDAGKSFFESTYNPYRYELFVFIMFLLSISISLRIMKATVKLAESL